MGVHGLWKLIEPSGQIVPLETLAGKVLAVDVSIWLHQAVKGMHDAHGAPIAVAHLLILFHRICKLLFYKIKPIFVFDGGVPALKRQTMAARRQRTGAAKNEAMKVREKLIKNLLKHEAVRQMLSDKTASAALGLNSFILPGPSVEEDLYKLPPIAAEFIDSESEAEEISAEESEQNIEDIHSVDVTSPEFLSLPPEVRHDILTELIETRKQSSWKHLDSMPKQSDSFSDFQMNRLLKRHAVQTSLEKAGKEMGGRALSLKELEALLGDQGILDPKIDLPSKRIAQDNVTRYMLVQKDLIEEEVKKTFDINKHLEDVGWSSESDTDIILERTSKIQEKSDKAEFQVTEINDQSCSKETEVRVAAEITEILSVLEPEGMTFNATENLEVLKSKSNMGKNFPETKSEGAIDKEKDATLGVTDHADTKKSIDVSKEGITSLFETSKETENKMTTEEESEAAEKNVNFICTEKSIMGSEKEIKVQLAKSSNKSEIEVYDSIASLHQKAGELEFEKTREGKNNHVKIEENKLGRIENEGRLDISESAEEVLMSSDSENDFISIDTPETTQICQKLPEISSPPSEILRNSDNSITVVINPLKSDTKDDMFADIFVSMNKYSGSIENNGIKETQKPVEDLNEIKATVDQFSMNNVDDLKKVLEQEHDDLMKEKGKQERHALNPTDQMYSDAQEMLRLFGIPFVVAPMEAEAQCAALNNIGLTEGTITDDSDIWLFGGQVVYKNFFNQSKHVLEYRSENIQKYFKLTREEMIKIALLVGSDYTVGLNGIGPVTALEILAAFQVPNQGILDSLQNFRDWFTGQNKKGSQKTNLRTKIKNTVILPGFPNRAVVEAYLNPEVDNSKEPFSWAKPNLEMIRKYVKARLGWSSDKCDELLRPVIKKLEETTTQSTIKSHFKIIKKQPASEKNLSKRLEKAIRHLNSGSPDTEESDEQETERKPKKKRKASTSNDVANIPADTGRNNETKATKKSNVAEPAKSKNSCCGETSKIKIINQKLYQDVVVPQKEMTQKMLENRKQEAIKIFRTFKRGRKKTRVYAKEKVTLSESSSEDD